MVGGQTELSGRVLYLALSPWALCPPGAQVLGDREAPKRKQSEHREHDVSEASERQAQHRVYREEWPVPIRST